jgi:hypothetical protein
MGGTRKGAVALLCGLTVLAAGLLGGAGSAATTTKPYTANVTPSPVTGGGTQTFQFTIENKASPQTLGSANVTLPAAWGSAIGDARLTTGPLPPGSSFTGTTVFLRNLGIAAGSSKTVLVDVAVPCVGGSFTWGVTAKQSNNFSGPPGNDFVRVAPSSLTTDVTGGCALRFRTQPQNAVVGATITGADLDPNGPPVEVDVVDGNGDPVTGATGTVSIALQSGTGLAGTLSQPLVGGVAAFDDLSIAASGFYNLVASATGFVSVTSAAFQIGDAGAICPNTDSECVTTKDFGDQKVLARSTTLNNGNTQGFTEMLLVDLGGAPPAGFCAGLDDLIGPGVNLDVRPLAGVTEVLVTIPKSVRQFKANNGLALMDVCLGTNLPFTTKGGTLSPSTTYDFDGDGDLDTRYLGLLPNCPASTAGTGDSPCFASRRSVQGGAEFLFRVPFPYDPSWWNG